MEERRITLVDLPSGKIEFVHNGVFQILQFNASCIDALPYCKGMCCGLRSGFNVLLQVDEHGKFRSVPHPRYPGQQMLETKPTTDNCVYQDDASGKCTIQHDKPWMCGAWHCSPGGVGEGIEHRDGGWFMTPMAGNIQDQLLVNASK